MNRARAGTTYEASCYTDPLALEHLTGSLSALISWMGEWGADAQLRFTSKFDAVGPLLGRPHPDARVDQPAKLCSLRGRDQSGREATAALADMGRAGFRLGLTIAPIIAAAGWREACDALIADAAAALGDLPDSDLTVELITHRYTPSSKATLESWYPGSALARQNTATSSDLRLASQRT